MSLRNNIIANYISQIYVSIIGVIILPLYIKHMGAEAYGLIGFFTMLQAWFALLDLGLTPTIGRETARYRAGALSAVEYRQLFRALNLIFIVVAIVGGGLLLGASELLATRWLNFDALAKSQVVQAVQVMAMCVAMRWMGGLYRGVLTGNERLVWLSGFNVIIATLRFLAVFVTMWIYGFTPVVFFFHQLIVALIEFTGLLVMARRLLPRKVGQKIGWSFRPLRPLLKFALSIAFTSSVWILVTQTDKMILSGILPLKEYGHFTLAVLAASVIMVLSGPIANAILPRMAKLQAESNTDELIAVYRNSTRFLAVFAGSVSITLAFCAKPLLVIWTGDVAIAESSAPILSLYACGNGLLALAAFPYYLQYAKGNLRYHLIGSLVTVFALVPLLIYSASHYGAVGAGWAWFSINALFFLFWVTYVHFRLHPGLHWKWLFGDCLRVIVPTSAAVGGVVLNLRFSENQFVSLFQIASTGMLALLVAALFSGRLISIVLKKIRF